MKENGTTPLTNIEQTAESLASENSCLLDLFMILIILISLLLCALSVIFYL